MPTIQLTFEQVAEAVRQLPEGDRQRLLSEANLRPHPERLRAAAGQLRKKYQAKPKQQKRMSELLAKGNAGTLTPEESRELDQLVEDYGRRTAAMADELAAACGITLAPLESRSA
ncbi:MAG TPA: hypothetical protein PLF81_03735 [Candidatus Anammoximicrobium sp.]|nr:hypothetical protein [Candidatus Anammoximicrobium sp.]